LKRDGVCNPVTHVLKAIEVAKRFSRGYNPRPAMSKTALAIFRGNSWSDCTPVF